LIINKGVFALTEYNLFDLPEVKYIHFIGIGGSSMSGLAEILLNQGYTISGSDMKESSATQKLQSLGVKVYTNHSKDNIESPDLVVYTAAVKDDNPELIKARKLNIPTVERADLLGDIMKKYAYSIAISGTHGKTTTTSMVSMIMIESGLDPTIHIGGELDAIGGNTKIGGDKYFVTEACEYVESFLKFYPYLAIVLNIDADHLDYFKDIEHIKRAFYKFTSLVPQNGYVVGCADDANVVSLLESLHCNKVTYGMNSESVTWGARDITFNSMGCATFTLLKNREEVALVTLDVPGIHNVSNALAAAAACSILGCDIKGIKNGLEKFGGTKKRFEQKGFINGIRVVHDYAHHPTEVKATLKAAKNTDHSKIWCVFQPHTYTRLKALLNEFAEAFEYADEVIVADIYAAREKDNGEIHASILAERINEKGSNATYIGNFEDIVAFLRENAAPKDLILTMGAGDIDKVGEMFLNKK
jgi:UDP-N-acetylmuramate--alanine ligase